MSHFENVFPCWYEKIKHSLSRPKSFKFDLVNSKATKKKLTWFWCPYY